MVSIINLCKGFSRISWSHKHKHNMETGFIAVINNCRASGTLFYQITRNWYCSQQQMLVLFNLSVAEGSLCYLTMWTEECNETTAYDLIICSHTFFCTKICSDNASKQTQIWLIQSQSSSINSWPLTPVFRLNLSHSSYLIIYLVSKPR